MPLRDNLTSSTIKYLRPKISSEVMTLLDTIADHILLVPIRLVVMIKNTGGDLALEIGLIKGPLMVRMTTNRNGCLQRGSQAEIEVRVLTQSICLMK